MHYIVYCEDHEDAVERRLANYEAHKAYLQTAPVKVLISGPLTDESGDTMNGSFFLYETENRAALEKFLEEDPFNKANVWKTKVIRRFVKRVDVRS